MPSLIHISPYFYPVGAGTEKQSFLLIKQLIELGYSNFVLTRRIKGLKKFEQIDNVKIFRLFTLGKGLIASIIFMVSIFFKLIILRKEFDIIFAYMIGSHTLSCLVAGKLLKKPIVVKLAGARETGDIHTSMKTFLGRLKLKVVKNLIDLYIAPSNELKNEAILYKFPAERITIIPNGVDTCIFSPVSADVKRKKKLEKFKTEREIVIYTGRFVEGKGLDFLIRVWSKINFDAKLFLVGDGYLKKSLLSLSNDLKVKNIYFFSWQENISEFLQCSDIFVLPSLGEGMSNSLLEAMACGLAVIGNDIGGINEVITDGYNGFLVEPNNLEKWVEKLELLLKNVQLRNKFGENVLKTIQENFSIKNIAQKYSKIIFNFCFYKNVVRGF